MRYGMFSKIAVAALFASGFVLFVQDASAQSSASDSPGLANNLVSGQTTAAASSQVTGLVGNAVSNAISPPPTLAAGNVPTGTSAGDSDGIVSLNSRNVTGRSAGNESDMGVWIQGAYTWVENDDTGGEFDGNVVNVIVGGDYQIQDNLLVGMSVGYEDLDVDTTFNNGTFEGQGIGVTPYLGISISDRWAVQVMGGYTAVEYDTTRNSGAITGSFDADRYFGMVGVSGSYFVSDSIAVSPNVSVMQVREIQDAYTDSSGSAVGESAVDLGRMSAGATVSYVGQMASPYVRVLGEYDYLQEDAVDLGGGNFSSNDDMGLNVSLGANLHITDSLTGTFEGTSGAEFRENLDLYTVSGRLRYEW